MCNRQVPALVDTGAQISTISLELIKAVHLQSLIQNTNRNICSVSGHIVKGIGEAFITIELEEQPFSGTFLVVEPLSLSSNTRS